MTFEEAVFIIGSKNSYVYFPQAQNRKIVIPYQQIDRVLVHGYNHSQVVVQLKDVSKHHDLVFEMGTMNDSAQESYQLKYTFLSYLTDAYRFSNRSRHGERKDIPNLPILVRFFL